MYRIRILMLILISASFLTATEPLRVCVTIPDLGDLARSVGGDAVVVTTFARGGDDPHFVDPRPSFAKALSRADLVVSVGLELEVGWLPVVLKQAHNPTLAADRPGWFEAAHAITVLGIPSGTVDRSHGDVHGGGNPHFLTDPVRGVQVAKAIARRFGELRPEIAEAVAGHYRAFAIDVAKRLVGEAAIQRVGDNAAIQALENDTMPTLIGDGNDLGGWLGLMKPVAGAAVIADHNLWPYLAQRFGLRVVAYLEPKPGIPPTTAHLAEIIQIAKSGDVKGIITVPYFDSQYAVFVARETGLPVIPLAHQVGALPDAADWLTLIDRNIRALSAGLGRKP